ncbi:hypothetical protein BHC44_09590 [Snodgrassella alvi]|nr:hypothetical protein BHC44_09590 [Snodgrassella alvi]
MSNQNIEVCFRIKPFSDTKCYEDLEECLTNCEALYAGVVIEVCELIRAYKTFPLSVDEILSDADMLMTEEISAGEWGEFTEYSDIPAEEKEKLQAYLNSLAEKYVSPKCGRCGDQIKLIKLTQADVDCFNKTGRLSENLKAQIPTNS